MDKTTDKSAVNFRLSQVDTAFSSRSYDVFSCLDSIEAQHKAFEKNQFDNRSDLLKPDPTDEPVARKTRFKIPKGMPRKSRLPDYRLRPDKWKTYSLLDVSPDQMSDLSNRRTALEFIESIQTRAAESCPDTSVQMDDDCTDERVGLPGFASHKQHLFQKPAVPQSLKQTKVDENQLELKAAQMVGIGPNLWIEQTEDENEGASCESIVGNIGEDAESSVDNTLNPSTNADSTEAHFQSKGLKFKNKRIRPRTLAEECEEDDSMAENNDFQEAQHADYESDKNSDESDEFGDYAVETTYSDEERLSGLAEPEQDASGCSNSHYEEQDNSNDEESINPNSCIVLGQDDIKLQDFEKDEDCADDLDAVD